MKTSSVDIVVTGDETAAVAAAVDALRHGQRVLVVLRSAGAGVVPRLRRLSRAAKNQPTVMTNAEVVCVDGVNGVEAVVIRYTRTGRLCAVNTPAFLSCDCSKRPARSPTATGLSAAAKLEHGATPRHTTAYRSK